MGASAGDISLYRAIDQTARSKWFDPAINGGHSPRVGDFATNAVRGGHNVCDLCGKNFPEHELEIMFDSPSSFTPSTSDTVSVDINNYGWMVVCGICALAEGEGLVVPKVFSGGKKKSKTTTVTPPTYDSGLQSMLGGSYGTTYTYGKCPDGHHMLFSIEGISGELRLTSSRGKNGGRIDYDADACLFFDYNSWGDKFKPGMTMYPGETGFTIPQLGQNKPRPPAAVFRWTDMSAPPDDVAPYVKWVVEQLRDNKRIQIGCIGAHGRTGTFLALLLLEADIVETAFEAYIIQGQEIECAASVGIALMPKHGTDLWHLVSIADQAMYNSKQISKEDAANDKAAYVEAAFAS